MGLLVDTSRSMSSAMDSERKAARSSRMLAKFSLGHDLAIHADDKNLFAEARYILQDFPQIGQFHNSVFKFQLSDGAILIRGREEMQNAN